MKWDHIDLAVQSIGIVLVIAVSALILTAPDTRPYVYDETSGQWRQD